MTSMGALRNRKLAESKLQSKGRPCGGSRRARACEEACAISACFDQPVGVLTSISSKTVGPSRLSASHTIPCMYTIELPGSIGGRYGSTIAGQRSGPYNYPYLAGDRMGLRANAPATPTCLQS